MKALLAAGGGTIALILGILLILTGGSGATARCGPSPTGGTLSGNLPDAVGDWQGTQLDIAATIISAAQALGISIHGQTVGVMVAMGESSLTNLEHGDGVIDPTTGQQECSLGVFQQQWCIGWGTRDEVLDPYTAATTFFTRLLQVEGWEQMEPSIAGNAVQGNLDPWYYERFWAPAQEVVAALSGLVAPGSTTCAVAAGGIVLPLDAPFTMSEDYGPRVAPTAGASTQHPAVDLFVGGGGEPVYAIQAGHVVHEDELYLTIQTPDGTRVSYLHMWQSDRLVRLGDQVQIGQQIGSVGNAPPSTGPHLDLRIDVTASTDPKIQALPIDPGVAVAWSARYPNPEDYFALFGAELCGVDFCTRQY